MNNDTEKYYIIITHNDNFLYFVDKNSTSDGHIGFTNDIEHARASNGEWGVWRYNQFIKKIENTLRDYDEIIAHPNVIIMNEKTFKDVQYFKDKITLFNIGVYFKGYDTKKVKVEYDITNADLRKWKIKKIFDE